MQQELVRRDTAEVAVQPQAADILAAVQRAASDQTVDAEKMVVLWRLAKEMGETQAKQQYFADLSALQARIGRITKDGVIVIPPKDGKPGREQGRYATLLNVHKQVKPLMDEYGFALSFDAEWSDNRVLITGTLSHRGGHAEVKRVPLALDTSGSKNSTQAAGSTISYGQRYLIKMFLNIVEEGEDDDGNGGKRECITPDQALHIRDLIKEVRADEAKLLRWAGVETVEQMPKAKYEEAIKTLEGRRRDTNK